MYQSKDNIQLSTAEDNRNVLVYIRKCDKNGLQLSVPKQVSIQELKNMINKAIALPEQHQLLYMNGVNLDIYRYLEVHQNQIIHVLDRRLIVNKEDNEINLVIRFLNEQANEIEKQIYQFKVQANSKIKNFIQNNLRSIFKESKGKKLQQDQNIILMESGRILKGQERFLSYKLASQVQIIGMVSRNQVKRNCQNFIQHEIDEDLKNIMNDTNGQQIRASCIRQNVDFDENGNDTGNSHENYNPNNIQNNILQNQMNPELNFVETGFKRKKNLFKYQQWSIKATKIKLKRLINKQEKQQIKQQISQSEKIEINIFSDPKQWNRKSSKKNQNKNLDIDEIRRLKQQMNQLMNLKEQKQINLMLKEQNIDTQKQQFRNGVLKEEYNSHCIGQESQIKLFQGISKEQEKNEEGLIQNINGSNSNNGNTLQRKMYIEQMQNNNISFKSKWLVHELRREAEV